MKLSQFKFQLPENLIAQYPAETRDESRLMVVNRKTGEIEHKVFKDVIGFFNDGDMMIFNDTLVFPARLFGNKEKTGARIEVFLLRELNAENKLWDAHYASYMTGLTRNLRKPFSHWDRPRFPPISTVSRRKVMPSVTRRFSPPEKARLSLPPPDCTSAVNC